MNFCLLTTFYFFFLVCLNPIDQIECSNSHWTLCKTVTFADFILVSLFLYIGIGFRFSCSVNPLINNWIRFYFEWFKVFAQLLITLSFIQYQISFQKVLQKGDNVHILDMLNGWTHPEKTGICLLLRVIWCHTGTNSGFSALGKMTLSWLE